MKFDAITNRLSEKQKQRLREAKSNEDRGGLFTPDKLKLTDDQFDKVAGGGAEGKTGNGGTLKKRECDPNAGLAGCSATPRPEK